VIPWLRRFLRGGAGGRSGRARAAGGRSGPGRAAGAQANEKEDAARRIDAAQQRLKQTIPPPEDEGRPAEGQAG